MGLVLTLGASQVLGVTPVVSIIESVAVLTSIGFPYDSMHVSGSVDTS